MLVGAILCKWLLVFVGCLDWWELWFSYLGFVGLGYGLGLRVSCIVCWSFVCIYWLLVFGWVTVCFLSWFVVLLFVVYMVVVVYKLVCLYLIVLFLFIS